ncbi:21153_t:CDS:2, partial [Racocetra persica]
MKDQPVLTLTYVTFLLRNPKERKIKKKGSLRAKSEIPTNPNYLYERNYPKANPDPGSTPTRRKSNKISILQTREDKLEISQETYSSNKDDFFNTYKSEDDLEKVESYYMDRGQTDDKKLYLNPWENVYSPAIYLTAIKEISTPNINKKPKPTFAKIINEL